MTDQSNDYQARRSAGPADQASVRDLEADIAETRGRLAGSVDQLTAKLDVKNQASEKIQDVKAQAEETVEQARQQVVQTSRSLISRFQAASRTVQVSLAAAPVALLVFLIARKARS